MPASLGPPVGQHAGGRQILDAPSAGQLLHVAGDTLQDRGDPIKAYGHVGGVWPVAAGAQVHHGRVSAGAELGQPAGGLTQPLRLVIEPVSDQVTPGQLGFPAGVRVLGRGPAGLPQLAERDTEPIDVNAGQ